MYYESSEHLIKIKINCFVMLQFSDVRFIISTYLFMFGVIFKPNAWIDYYVS